MWRVRRCAVGITLITLAAASVSACTAPTTTEAHNCRWHDGILRLPPDSLWWCGPLPPDSLHFYAP